MLDDSPNILNMFIRRLEKFLRAFEKKFWVTKKAFLKHGFVLDQPDSESEFFKIQIFSKALRKFSKRRMIMFNIFGNLSNIISLRSKKKIRVIRHVKQIIWQETYKSLDFWKSTLRIGLVKYRAMLQKCYFLKRIFFKDS